MMKQSPLKRIFRHCVIVLIKVGPTMFRIEYGHKRRIRRMNPLISVIIVE